MNKWARLIFLFAFFLNGMIAITKAQSGQWTWMKGDSTYGNTDQTFNSYGVKDVPDSANTPPKVYAPMSWIGKDRLLYLLGGGAVGNPQFGWQSNDAFMSYDINTNTWTWVGGNSWLGATVIYGTKGSGDNLTYPGGRYGSCTWVDNDGNFWLFGGTFSSVYYAPVNDLWKYDIQTKIWTWVSGTNLINDVGTYGMKGVPDTANAPSSRFLADNWIDKEGNLWLFGGWHGSDGPNGQYLNDLWKYDIKTNQWTWMNGSSQIDQPGIYGIKGIADSLNTPGARENNQLHWVDSIGNFYLYGGNTLYPKVIMFNDLWKYTSITNEWTWIGGSDIWGDEGIYTDHCAPGNTASAREQATGWVDKNGIFWFFAGDALSKGGVSITNELWKYNPYNNTWSWLDGSYDFYHYHYGKQGISSPENYPHTRFGCTIWYDSSSNNVWMFGGTGNYHLLDDQTLNDLWKYVPDTACDVATGNMGPIEFVQVSIYPNPATDQLHIEALNIHNATVTILNLFGQVVLKQQFSDNGSIDISFLPKGMYLINIRDERGNVLQKGKVVKE
ncbi:MAG: T9SS type A sorting domain-containing protein [Chitinophagales bacterium]|nr:T9SS type A sorting domain-containing protein [Chitinophagales bacterium]